MDSTVVLVIVIGISVVLGLLVAIVRAMQNSSSPASSPPAPPSPHIPYSNTASPSPLPSSPSPAPPPSILKVTQGTLNNQHFSVSAKGVTIGRNTDNDIVLADSPAVSRYHAEIVVEEGEYILYDRDSANGTLVNGQPVARYTLNPNDRIQIWKTEFVFNPTPQLSQVRSIVMPQHEHKPGDRFEEFILERKLGEGGMSKVFLGRDAAGQYWAVKILEMVSNSYLVKKFDQEGNKVGPVLRNHSGIVRTYFARQSRDKVLYLVMEYVDGEDLRQYLYRMKNRPMDETAARRILGEACDAVGYAHQCGIVHRDLKPDNIMLTKQNKVKVTDFGIAKFTSAVTVTSNKLVGTPEYMSPEQAQGERVSSASDVYALGIILYEMVTGRVPFPRPNISDERQAMIAVIEAHVNRRPQAPRHCNSNIPRELEKIILKALEKKPQDRFEDAMELRDELGYVPPEHTPLPQPPLQAQLILWRGRGQGECINIGKILARKSRLEMGRENFDKNNTYVSRNHVLFSLQGQQICMEDNSRNGTWLNGQRVYGEVVLQDGDKISIGHPDNSQSYHMQLRMQ